MEASIRACPTYWYAQLPDDVSYSRRLTWYNMQTRFTIEHPLLCRRPNDPAPFIIANVVTAQNIRRIQMIFITPSQTVENTPLSIISECPETDGLETDSQNGPRASLVVAHEHRPKSVRTILPTTTFLCHRHCSQGRDQCGPKRNITFPLSSLGSTSP